MTTTLAKDIERIAQQAATKFPSEVSEFAIISVTIGPAAPRSLFE
jgi:hypothetical protein